MTLLELLVKELPKHGGWTEHVYHVTQDSDGQVNGYGSSTPTLHRETWAHQGFFDYLFNNEEMDLCEDWHTAIITRDQYEAALAASQQPVWDGEGLPPSGVHCEWQTAAHPDGVWSSGRVNYISDFTVVFGIDIPEDPDKEVVHYIDAVKFRPIRTEAERKRTDVAQQMCNLFGNGIKLNEKEGYGKAWLDVYDAIAAGKIPGVKLTDGGE